MPKRGFWRELLQAAGEGARQGVSAYGRSGGKASAAYYISLEELSHMPTIGARDYFLGALVNACNSPPIMTSAPRASLCRVSGKRRDKPAWRRRWKSSTPKG